MLLTTLLLPVIITTICWTLLRCFIYSLRTLSHLLFPRIVGRVFVYTWVDMNACIYGNRCVYMYVNNSHLLSDSCKIFDKCLNPWKEATLDTLTHLMKYWYKICIMYQASHISIRCFDWLNPHFEKKRYLFSCSFLHFNIKYNSTREGSAIP